MIAVIHVNNADLRHRLAEEGFMLCKCSEESSCDSLTYTDYGFYEIHGIDLSVEEHARDFGKDVEAFIKYCKEMKRISMGLTKS